MDIRLAVVDGHTLIRYGLRELAQNPKIQIVAECSSMANAWSVLQAAQPDVVTADVALPDGDGMQLARQLRDLTAIRHAAVAASSFTATGLAAALARRHAAQDRFALRAGNDKSSTCCATGFRSR